MIIIMMLYCVFFSFLHESWCIVLLNSALRIRTGVISMECIWKDWALNGLARQNRNTITEFFSAFSSKSQTKYVTVFNSQLLLFASFYSTFFRQVPEILNETVYQCIYTWRMIHSRIWMTFSFNRYNRIQPVVDTMGVFHVIQYDAF